MKHRTAPLGLAVLVVVTGSFLPACFGPNAGTRGGGQSTPASPEAGSGPGGGASALDAGGRVADAASDARATSGAGGSAGAAGVAGTGGAGGMAADAGANAARDSGGSADMARDTRPVDTMADASRAADTAPGPAAAKVPAEYLDLANWKITLPIGEADEVKQPQLATYQLRPYFYLEQPGHVVFRAHAGGGTTSNSGYPRSELREMTNGGRSNASWSTTSGKHTMVITQSITHTLVRKPHVVAGQIHDASDDLLMVRLEGSRLFVEAKGEEVGDLDPSYKLGTRFTVKIEAAAGRVKIFYNDLTMPKVDLARSATGCYFKAGVYTQSNPERGEAATAYGEVHMFDLKVTHE